MNDDIQVLINQANKFLTNKANSVASAIRGLMNEFDNIEDNQDAFEVFQELCDLMAGYDVEEYKKIVSC